MMMLIMGYENYVRDIQRFDDSRRNIEITELKLLSKQQSDTIPHVDSEESLLSLVVACLPISACNISLSPHLLHRPRNLNRICSTWNVLRTAFQTIFQISSAESSWFAFVCLFRNEKLIPKISHWPIQRHSTL